MLPLVSIIIPHWNGINLITDCLSSIEKSTYPNLETIVVDNNSEDDSVNRIKSEYPKVIVVENNCNEGYAGGCNRGSEIAKGEYLLFLNNDTVQITNWIEPLVSVLNKDKSVAAVQPKILNFYKKKLFDYAGGAGGEMDFLKYLDSFRYILAGEFALSTDLAQQYDSSDEIFWSSGTAFIVRRSIFEYVGKFDELFFAHMEEIDLCWRLHLAGYKVISEPQSVIYHKNAVTLPMHSEKKYYLNHRNSLLMILANYSIPLSIYVLPIRWSLDIVAIIYAILFGDWNHIKGIAKAHAWIVFHPHEIYKKRKKVKLVRKEKDKDILKKMYNGSIVYSHYIMRKNRYSELSLSLRS